MQLSGRVDAQNFLKRTWIKHWAGHWQLLNNSLLGFQYTRLLRQSIGAGLEYAIFISHKGYSVCYLDSEYYKKFGTYLATHTLSNERQLEFWTKSLQQKTDLILNLIKRLRTKRAITDSDYTAFVKAFFEYGLPHRVIKIVVDALPPDKLSAFMPQLEKARLYGEPVYAETERFLEFIASQIAKKIGLVDKHVACMTKEEMDRYWKTGQLPAKLALQQRYQSSPLLYQRGQAVLLAGNSSDKFEASLEKIAASSKEIRGSVAYPGKVKGTVRIVFDPKNVSNFKSGNILVTGMTRPEYLELVKKSAAFVTDAGGMLSHAAITARELKKPCIVGTLNATKILKDGDIVEVDANQGIVRPVSNHGVR